MSHARMEASAPSRERRPHARVLFCTYNYAPGTAGGAERQAQLQAEELVRRGYEVTVVCPRQPGLASEVINGVTVRRLPVPWQGRGRRPLHFLRLAAFLLTHLGRYDLVHVHLAGLQTEAAVPIARLFRRPVYVKIAAAGPGGDVQQYYSLPGLPRRFGLRHAHRVQVISRSIADDLRAAGVEDERLAWIPNGLNLTQFQPASASRRAEMRERLGLPASATIVLFIGRFHRVKGLFDLRAAWNEVSDPSALLVLVGGSEWSPLGTSELRSNAVEVRGWSPRIQEYYQAADIFVLPSHTEGMSNALLEAMACGLPAIATRVGAAEEMIQDGCNGLLVHPGDQEGLAARLRALIDDPALRTRLGDAASASVQSYSIEIVVDQIEREYAALMDARSSMTKPKDRR